MKSLLKLFLPAPKPEGKVSFLKLYLQNLRRGYAFILGIPYGFEIWRNLCSFGYGTLLSLAQFWACVHLAILTFIGLTMLFVLLTSKLLSHGTNLKEILEASKFVLSVVLPLLTYGVLASLILALLTG